MRLDNIRLLTVQFPAMFRFYRDVLGLEVTWGEPEGNYASFKGSDGLSSIGLFARALMSEALGTQALPLEGVAQDRIALVLELADLDGFATRASSAGAKFINTPENRPAWGTRVAHVRDPDSNLLEVFSPLPKGEWSADLLEEAEQQPS